ncbi:MAG: hypothetical protein WAP74_00540 [Patescibacteria group bacterium]
MSDQELPEGITIDREFWQDDPRGVNVNYAKGEIEIQAECVVEYYNEQSDLFRIVLKAQNREDDHIKIGRCFNSVAQAVAWINSDVANTFLAGLRWPGDMEHPTHAVFTLCYTMADELPRLAEFVKNDPGQKAIEEALMQHFETAKEALAVFDRLQIENGTTMST